MRAALSSSGALALRRPRQRRGRSDAGTSALEPPARGAEALAAAEGPGRGDPRCRAPGRQRPCRFGPRGPRRGRMRSGDTPTGALQAEGTRPNSGSWGTGRGAGAAPPGCRVARPLGSLRVARGRLSSRSVCYTRSLSPCGASPQRRSASTGSASRAAEKAGLRGGPSSRVPAASSSCRRRRRCRPRNGAARVVRGEIESLHQARAAADTASWLPSAVPPAIPFLCRSRVCERAWHFVVFS